MLNKKYKYVKKNEGKQLRKSLRKNYYWDKLLGQWELIGTNFDPIIIGMAK